jgi:DNA-binding NtrC family response regulator
VVLSGGSVLQPDDFLVGAGGGRVAAAVPAATTLATAVESAERATIAAALAATSRNRRDAAKLLGVSLRTLFYKLRQYGLE